MILIKWIYFYHIQNNIKITRKFYNSKIVNWQIIFINLTMILKKTNNIAILIKIMKRLNKNNYKYWIVTKIKLFDKLIFSTFFFIF